MVGSGWEAGGGKIVAYLKTRIECWFVGKMEGLGSGCLGRARI